MRRFKSFHQRQHGVTLIGQRQGMAILVQLAIEQGTIRSSGTLIGIDLLAGVAENQAQQKWLWHIMEVSPG